MNQRLLDKLNILLGIFGIGALFGELLLIMNVLTDYTKYGITPIAFTWGVLFAVPIGCLFIGIYLIMGIEIKMNWKKIKKLKRFVP